jgi:hypothetical protein
MDTGSVRERIGLDYLLKGAPERAEGEPKSIPSHGVVAASRSAVAFAARLVLAKVRELDDQHDGVRLKDVGASANMDAETLIPIAQGLEDAGLLKVLAKDEWANDLVTLGDRAADALDTSNQGAVLKLLGSEE